MGQSPESILAASRSASLRLAKLEGKKELLRVLERAAAELQQRLTQREAMRAAGRTTAFTEEQVRSTLLQVRDVTETVKNGMRRAIVDTSKMAADTASTDLINYLSAADAQFRGMASPLALDEASMYSRALQGVDSSLLHRLEDDPVRGPGILTRYGDMTVAKFEQTLRQGMMTGANWIDTRNALIADSPFLREAPAHWAERIVRTECLVGETPVSGAMVRAVFRRWYDGDVVDVITESGRKFTTTPNHPMLTTRSWVPSGKLHQGDYLVCYTGKQNLGSSGDEHVANPPTSIAEIFNTLSTVGVLGRKRTTRPDFHGDGADDYVDIACANSMLLLGDFAPVDEHLGKQIFTKSNRSNPTYCSRCHCLLSIQKQPCLCGTSYVYTRLKKSGSDGAIARRQLQTDALCTFTGNVTTDNVISGQVQPSRVTTSLESVGSGFASGSCQSEFAQLSFDCIGGESSLRSGILCAEPGDIELDRVVKVAVRHFSGHVFNLYTAHGYFAINGAYTGNTMGAYNRASWEGMREADDQLGDMVKILAATFDDRTGWDSYQVHGQIRLPDEAFEWNAPSGSYSFMHPPNRPNDREVVVPHRIAWVIPSYLEQLSDGEVLDAWLREKRKGTLPDRPTMTTVPLSLFGKPSK